MALAAVWRRMTLLDRGIVMALVLATAASFFLLGKAPRGAEVVVERGGKVIFRAPLAVDRSVTLEGPLGETVLSIHDRQACILASPCPHKVCMGMGHIAQQGELLACVPNRLLVRVAGAAKQERSYDLISR